MLISFSFKYCATKLLTTNTNAHNVKAIADLNKSISFIELLNKRLENNVTAYVNKYKAIEVTIKKTHNCFLGYKKTAVIKGINKNKYEVLNACLVDKISIVLHNKKPAKANIAAIIGSCFCKKY